MDMYTAISISTMPRRCFRNCLLQTRLLLGVSLFAIPAWAQDVGPKYITFDPPRSLDTWPYGINARGAVVGTYMDTTAGKEGFVRDPRGTIITFQANDSQQPSDTLALGINAAGAVTGSYTVPPGHCSRGYVRDPQGTITTFEADPTFCSYEGTGTAASSINSAGAIAGTYVNASGPHGFLRDPQGGITSFDPPGGPIYGLRYTAVYLNDAGVITGSYGADPNVQLHGFVRDAKGTITSFDPPGRTFTFPGGIDGLGTITGMYMDANHVGHGFVRHSDGTFTSCDPPGTCQMAYYCLTEGTGINVFGGITGEYTTGVDQQRHGFVRHPDGTITTFDLTGAPGTAPTGINWFGIITGDYYDSNYVRHGFIRVP
jgi:hypothetical protein